MYVTPDKQKMTVRVSWIKGEFMNITRNVGFLLLAIWLILTGLSAFISMGGLSPLLAILAIAAGIFILLGR